MNTVVVSLQQLSRSSQPTFGMSRFSNLVNVKTLRLEMAMMCRLDSGIWETAKLMLRLIHKKDGDAQSGKIVRLCSSYIMHTATICVLDGLAE